MSRAAVCLVAAVWLIAARPTRAQGDAASAAIAGRVLDASTGSPVRNARVRVTSTKLRETATADSDENGRFELTALSAGNYVVTATKPGYLGGAYGQPRPLRPGAAVAVAAGQRVEPIDVRLQKGGVLAGSVENEFGQPQPGVDVAALRSQDVGGVRRLVMVARHSTDDRGGFRVFDLPPGRYYLSATVLDYDDRDTHERSVDAPTYYPGTASVDTARVLTVKAGQTIAGLRMKLVALPPVRVSGIVTSSRGVPLQFVSVRLNTRAGTGPAVSRETAADADGRFMIPRLTPGEYVLRASTAAEVDGESATMPVVVGNRDVVGLRLVTGAAKIRGRILMAPSEADLLKGAKFRLAITAANADESELTGGSGGAIKDDLTFEFPVRPGRLLISSDTPGWVVGRVLTGDKDVVDTGFEVRENESLTDVRVFVTAHSSAITGTVITQKGEVTRDAYVVVFARDPNLWGYARFVRMARPDSDNRFEINMPQGDYLAVAVDSLEDGEWKDPAFLRRVAGRGVAATVSGGGRTQITLTLP
jgi:5-hydroxyisourate hydrolase-like protein (transthyretin family)